MAVGIGLVLVAGCSAAKPSASTSTSTRGVGGAPSTLANGASVLTGFIEPCVGALPVSAPKPPYAAGTVVALRGVERLRPVPGGLQQVLPTDVAGRVHVKENEAYRFVLAPGKYVLVGTYDNSGGMQTFLSVTLVRGTTSRRNMPNDCK